jgi:2-dehydropantoate 2-reductase
MLGSLGEDVSLVVRAEKLAGYPAELTLERPTGVVRVAAKAVGAVREAVDVLWIATKAYQLLSALEIVKAVPKCVVPLLNGVDHVAVLRARFGDAAVVPGTITSETEMAAPGRFVQRSPVVRLNLAASGEAVLGGIAERLDKGGVACRFVANEQTLLWGKLCFLAPFALTTSASGKNVGEVLADAEWNRELNGAIAEACAVAEACGAEVAAAQIRGIFDGVPGVMRSSMQKDVVAGREPELDAIGGPVVRGGERFGLDVATTARLMAAIRGKRVSIGA